MDATERLSQLINVPLNPSRIKPNGGKMINMDNIDKLDVDPIILSSEYLEITKEDVEEDNTLVKLPVGKTESGHTIVTYIRPYIAHKDDTIIDIAIKGCPYTWYNTFHRAYSALLEISDAMRNINTNLIVPSRQNIFNAFKYCNFYGVKVIIIGQGPYPWVEDSAVANGLAFSTTKGAKIENSLRNIFKELKSEYEETDTPFVTPDHGDLTSWAKQGVLLLNSTLTGEMKRRGEKNTGARKDEPHKGRWNSFLKVVLNDLTRHHEKLIFVLWGQDAQKTLDHLGVIGKHIILKSAHPSGLARSAKDKFEGCGHFKQINELLMQHGKPEIDWRIE